MHPFLSFGAFLAGHTKPTLGCLSYPRVTTHAHKYFILNIFSVDFISVQLKDQSPLWTITPTTSIMNDRTTHLFFCLLHSSQYNKFSSLLWACCRCVISNRLKYFWVSWQRICYTSCWEDCLSDEWRRSGRAWLMCLRKNFLSWLSTPMVTIYASCKHCMWMQCAVGSLT